MRADLFRYEGDRGGGETPYAKARGALEQAAALAKESGDATAEGKVLLAMGRLCSSRNDLELATRTWGLAASKFMESGDKPMLAVTEDLLRDVQGGRSVRAACSRDLDGELRTTSCEPLRKASCVRTEGVWEAQSETNEARL